MLTSNRISSNGLKSCQALIHLKWTSLPSISCFTRTFSSSWEKNKPTYGYPKNHTSYSNPKQASAFKQRFSEYSHMMDKHHQNHTKSLSSPEFRSTEHLHSTYPHTSRLDSILGLEEVESETSSESPSSETYPQRFRFSDKELPSNQDWMAKRLKGGQIFQMSDLSTENYFDSLPRKKFDLFTAMGTDPCKMYKHVNLLSLFVTETGMIMHHKDTNLSIVNQRKLSRMIKRARAMGLMPYTSRLPLPRPNFSDPSQVMVLQ